MEKRLFTSESVTEGHPDKMCDQISDAVLDALLEQDPMSRVACETCTNTGFVMVMGEITTQAYVDIQKIVRDVVTSIGYNKSEYGFDGNTCAVITAIDEQSADIAMGVDKALELKTGARSLKTTVESAVKEARWHILENPDEYKALLLTKYTVEDNLDCVLIDNCGNSHKLKDLLKKEEKVLRLTK